MIRLRQPSDSARTTTLILGFAMLFALMFTPSASADSFEPLAVDSPLLEKLDESQAVDPSAPAAPEEPAAGPRLDRQPTFLAWPGDGPVESGFAWRWGKRHEGLDIDGDTGDAIRAAAFGKVSMAESDHGYGLTVELAHTGNFAGLRTRYSHLSRMDVEVGDWVETGQIVGLMGTTGFVTGSHLHFEVHDDGGPLNPLRFLVDRGDESDPELG